MAKQPDRPCVACGGESQAQDLRVVFGQHEYVGPDLCPRCGRLLVYRVEFDKCG